MNKKEIEDLISFLELYGEKSILGSMVKDASNMDILGNTYDLAGRIQQANIPSNYSFGEMNSPLGASGSAGPELNIQDIIQQRNILNDLVGKMSKTTNVFNKEHMGVDTGVLDSVLNAANKLQYMTNETLNWSEEDTDAERNTMIENILNLYKKTPGEFPKYKNIEELSESLQ